ncbi:MAG: N-6 DNA methylase [Candidatus Dadabacteria bacterium]|nr:N-6 DNA methylase [Candidatus Dadabacteria bacterium]
MKLKKSESRKKLRGGYYTPYSLARYLSQWVAEANPKTILEPSCGDGIFLESLSRVTSGIPSVTAIEVDGKESRLAYERATKLNSLSVDIKCTDFLEWSLTAMQEQVEFDAVVGNPPFIRYQYLTKRDQELSEQIFKRHNLSFTKHTNAWVPFVVASLSLLRPGGRIAMVLPAEILHVLHAQSLRSYVGQQCKHLIIIDPEEIWFDGTLQGVVLLLAEKKSNIQEHAIGLGIVQTRGKRFLSQSPSEHFQKSNFINGKTVEGKWTRALLSKKELDAFDNATNIGFVHRFSDIAEVDVGLVTGANRFFLVDDETVSRYELEKWSHPMFGRSGHCPGILYDERQHKQNSDSGLPSNFLWFDVADISELPDGVIEYIRSGENQNLHTRYKCRSRKPWFKVPSVYSTSVGMLKRAHNMPRLIYNELGAYTTDTAYRITTNSIDARRLVYCFINSLTAMSSEIEGRHYGGGVLELVPSEIEKLYVPLPSKTRIAMKELDKMIKDTLPDEVLCFQDSKVLKDVGLTRNEIVCLHNAWNNLRRRRQRVSASTSQ